jgi:predicted signal transduction protein with EAL and GGDEF domain
VLLEGAEQVIERLRQYRTMGLQVALDDFGTGYSSLSHLKRFDIDYVKIDQSFVQTLETDVGDLALCEAIIVMAHKLGLKVVAEGVETKVQRALLPMPAATMRRAISLRGRCRRRNSKPWRAPSGRAFPPPCHGTMFRPRRNTRTAS